MFTFFRKIQDYLLVSFFTVLIWLYAEGRNVQRWPSDGLVSVPIVIHPRSPDMVVAWQSAEKVGLQFKGASSEVDRIRRRIGTGLDVPLDGAEEGEHELMLSDLLANSPAVEAAKVNLNRIEPATIKVRVEKLETRPVDVVFEPDSVKLVENSLQYAPARVKLTMPHGAWATLGDSPLVAESLVDLKKLPAGQEQTVRARVRLPDSLKNAPDVAIKPSEVQLTFTIEKRELSASLPTVPVWVMMPPGEPDHFKVQLADDSRVLKDVKVSGTPELLAKVRDKTLPVIAYVRLSRDDLVKAVGNDSTATVRFDVPPGLVVDSATTTVRFTVTRAQDTAVRPIAPANR